MSIIKSNSAGLSSTPITLKSLEELGWEIDFQTRISKITNLVEATASHERLSSEITIFYNSTENDTEILYVMLKKALGIFSPYVMVVDNKGCTNMQELYNMMEYLEFLYKSSSDLKADFSEDDNLYCSGQDMRLNHR